MRVALEVLRVVRERDLAHHLRDPGGVLLAVAEPCASSTSRAGCRSGAPGSATRPGPGDVGDQRATKPRAARRRPSRGCPRRRAAPCHRRSAGRGAHGPAETARPWSCPSRTPRPHQHLAGSDLEGCVRHDGDAVVGLDPEVRTVTAARPPGRGRLVCQLVGLTRHPFTVDAGRGAADAVTDQVRCPW